MRVADILAQIAEKSKDAKIRKPSRYDEHHLQCAEVDYVRAKHPTLSRIFFAVPNGQKRTKMQTTWLHSEGLVNGVSDMILLKPNKHYSYLCIENKTPKGKQSPEQKLFQQDVEKNGGYYAIVRSIDEFISLITNYLNNEKL